MWASHLLFTCAKCVCSQYKFNPSRQQIERTSYAVKAVLSGREIRGAKHWVWINRKIKCSFYSRLKQKKNNF